MKTKLRFLFVLLTMLWWGANFAWGETDVFDLTSFSSADVTNQAFTKTGTAFIISATSPKTLQTGKFSIGKETVITITPRFSALTVESITFTNIGSSGVSGDNLTLTIKDGSNNVLNANALSSLYTSKGNPESPSSGTWTNSNSSVKNFIIAAGGSNSESSITMKSITITYTDSRSSLNPAFDWDKMEIHNAGGDQHTYVCSRTFVYDSSKDRMKVRLTVTPRYEGIYGTISSTDETVLKTTTSTLSGPTATTVGEQDAWEIYIDNIQVLKTGSATLRFWFNGNESYKPATLEIPITVIDHSVTPFNNSYRYTWDFAGGNWESTIAQLGYGNGSGGYNWTKTIDYDSDKAEARPTYKEHWTIPAQNGLDIIEGLKFELPIDEGTGYANPNDLCLDWYEGRKAVWLNTNVKVTISNLVKDQTITITANHDDYIIDAGSATKSGNVITVTGAGNVTLKMAQATRISSIAVSNSSYRWSYTTKTASLDNKERPIKGTFTFTEAGPIEAGTEINEVPGIKMTVGNKESTYSWDVIYTNGRISATAPSSISPAVTGRTSANNWIPTDGYYFVFEPYVNGFIKLNGHFFGGSGGSVGELKEEDGTIIHAFGSTTDGDVDITSNALLAGKKYYLYSAAYPLELHSFTFRPAFLNPANNTDQLAAGNFVATIGSPAKDGFPKLIDPSSETQQNKVKFAGDKAKVYLYKNNDVYLLAAGNGILIRGTVLDKNNEDGLVAYYYLNSQIITLKSTEKEDQAYISSDGLTDDKYTFTYHGNIVASGGTLTVKVKKDTEEEGDVTATVNSYDSSNDETTIDIPFASLEEGATYRVRIPTNTLQLSGSSTVKNSEVVRTFSVNKDGEAQVKMIYPTGIATVGTAIILETYINGEAKNVNDGHKVKGILSDGSSNLNLDATFSSSQIVFKPETTLKPNTTYTLTIPTEFGTEPNIVDNKIYLSDKYTTSPDVYYQVTHNKVFTFTTGSSSGTEPQVIPNGTYPAEGAVVPNGEYSGGTISFTFDQTVELEPYSTVSATPINGSESTAHGSTGAPNAENNTLTVSADGKTVSFDYPADGLKYDLYYQVVIPANTVIGVGGLPNSSPITLNFKMDKKSSSNSKISSSSFPGYPHTWNFTNIGTITTTKSNLSTYATSERKSTTRWLYNGTDKYYGNYSKDVEFPQGEVLSYYGTNDVEIAETRGLRWSLTKSISNSGSVDHRIRFSVPDGGSGKLVVMGNTHYMTIPDVPVGKLYIKANKCDILNVNSPNAVFTQGGTTSDNTKGETTNSSKVYILNVTEPGDVTFCLDDVYFEMIAVATEEKAISSVGYATNARSFPVDYTLDGELSGTEVIAYKITGVSGNSVIAERVERVPATTGVGQNNGVMLQGGEGSWPLFTLDVNSTEETLTDNKLIGVLSGDAVGAVDQKTGNNYNYILATGGYSVRYKEGQEIGSVDAEISDQLGFYLLLKDGTKMSNGSTYSAETLNDNTAYLQLAERNVVHTGVGVGAARQFFYINIDDDTNGISTMRTNPDNGVSNGAFYSLQGVRSAKPAKGGLYIHNGKKVIVK